MGMHEFEDVVQASIRVLAKHNEDHDVDLRSAFYTLYEYQAMFDTGFTNLRVIDLLLKHRYSYKLRVDDHPDYEEHKEFFDSLDDFAHIYINPSEPWDGEVNPAAGYYHDGSLYCDAGSALWKRLVEASILTGEDALEPRLLPFSELVAQIVSLAERDGDTDLIRMWFPLFIYGAIEWMPGDLETFKQDPHVHTIREIVARTKVRQIEMDYGYLALPTKGEVKGSPLLEWWFYTEGADDRTILETPRKRTGISSEQQGQLLGMLKTGGLEWLKSFIESGAPPNVALKHGFTPLHFAAGSPQAGELIRHLIEQGAEINAKDSLIGMTPLMSAASAGRSENVRILLEYGAAVNILSVLEVNSIFEAISLRALREGAEEQDLRRRIHDIVRLLIEAGEDVNQQSTYGETALHRAVEIEDLAIIHTLLEASAEINVPVKHPEENVKPVLSRAVTKENENIIKLLLTSGADPSIQDKDGITPLMEAIKIKRPDLVKLLWEKGYDPTLTDKEGSTPLVCAIRENVPEIVIFLLDQDISIDRPQGHHQRTPLALACMYGCEIEIIEGLISRGADPYLEDPGGMTPSLLAQLNNHREIVSWFRGRYPDLETRLPGRFGFLLYDSQEEEDKLRQGLGIDHGVLINQIYLDSPADYADFHKNDVLILLNGEEIKDRTDLYSKMTNYYEGDTVTCILFREGRRIEKEVKLAYIRPNRLKC